MYSSLVFLTTGTKIGFFNTVFDAFALIKEPVFFKGMLLVSFFLATAPVLLLAFFRLHFFLLPC